MGNSKYGNSIFCEGQWTSFLQSTTSAQASILILKTVFALLNDHAAYCFKLNLLLKFTFFFIYIRKLVLVLLHKRWVLDKFSIVINYNCHSFCTNGFSRATFDLESVIIYGNYCNSKLSI